MVVWIRLLGLAMVLLLLAGCDSDSDQVEPASLPVAPLTPTTAAPVDTTEQTTTVLVNPAEATTPAVSTSTTGATTTTTASDSTSLWQSSGTWINYTNANLVVDVAVDHAGSVWAVGPGGAVRWDPVTFSFRKYTVADGLPSTAVSAASVGPDGSVWLATGGGLAHIAGNDWMAHRLAGGVCAVAVGGDGSVWAASETNLYRFSGAFDAIESAPVFGCPEDMTVAADGSLWVATNASSRGSSQVLRVIGTETHEPPLGAGLESGIDVVTGIETGPDGTIWIVSSGEYTTAHYNPELGRPPTPPGALYGFDGDSWIRHGQDEGLPWSHPRKIAIDPAGAVWIGGEGVAWLDGAGWVVAVDGLLGVEGEFAVDDSGVVWAPTHSGLARGDGEGWTMLLTDDSMPLRVPGIDGNSGDMVVDEAGHVWLAGCALVEFDGSVFTEHRPFGEEGGCFESLTLAPDGRVWGCGGAGVASSDGAGWVLYPSGEHFAYRNGCSIGAAPDGTVWMATGDTQGAWLYRFDGSTWTPHGPFFHDVGRPNVAVVGTDGAVWYAASAGPLRFDGVEWRQYRAASGAVLPGEGRHVLTVDQTMWIALPNWPWHEHYGLVEFDLAIEQYRWHDADAGLPSDIVNNITLAGDGAVWAATDGGIARWDGTSWTSLTTADGLADDKAWQLATGPDGSVWVATDSGLSRFTPETG
jgi:ligand-binding sensor domain-containing protein